MAADQKQLREEAIRLARRIVSAEPIDGWYLRGLADRLELGTFQGELAEGYVAGLRRRVADIESEPLPLDYTVALDGAALDETTTMDPQAALEIAQGVKRDHPEMLVTIIVAREGMPV